MALPELLNKAKTFGQEKLFNFYEELTDEQKKILLTDVQNIDFNLMQDLFKKLTNTKEETAETEIAPIPCTDATSMCEEERKRLYDKGLQVLGEGKMAALTMAGGQGTRLGHTGPKGTYDIGLPSHKSLFEIQCCGLKKVSAQAGCKVQWYIMTSHINHKDTVEFFEKNNYFDYGKENITFFPQTMIPAMDREGNILLENKYTVLKSPNGNGGLFASLKNAGLFEKMRDKGISRIFICGIDNCLVKMADPMFLGFLEDSGHKAVAKSFIKRTADEKAGVFCRRGGKPTVIEYTEIPLELAELKDDAGVWVYGDTNVLNYIFDIDVAESLAEVGMSYHIAVKKLNCADFATGETVVIPNGYKFELFLFDAFSQLDSLGVFRIERKEEFAPVKNPTGVDSAESAREMYMAIHKEEN
ncbi:MAG: UTP--glucose-1-phosphate uridylyltransferase [Clostridia bacterium]|nr:UTP--glucose-1-phosphate uridylyltransferase [Clostridia bacterium]